MERAKASSGLEGFDPGLNGEAGEAIFVDCVKQAVCIRQLLAHLASQLSGCIMRHFLQVE